MAGLVAVLTLVVAAQVGQRPPDAATATSPSGSAAEDQVPTTPAGPDLVEPGLADTDLAEPDGGATAAAVPSVPGAAATRSAPQPTAPPATAAGTPVHVTIASIGVDSALEPLGLQDDGTLEVPATGFPAGWYTGGPVPGAVGPAVLAGHVDWAGEPGVFSRLARTAVGDLITVTDDAGRVSTFRVSSVGRYPKTAFPTAAVYGDVDHPALRLVTCGGDFDPQARSYVDDVVVFADEVPTA